MSSGPGEMCKNHCRTTNLLHRSSCLCVPIETVDVVMRGGVLQGRHAECLFIDAIPKGTDYAWGVGRVEASKVGNRLKVNNNRVNAGRAECICAHSLLNGQLLHLDILVLGGAYLHFTV